MEALGDVPCGGILSTYIEGMRKPLDHPSQKNELIEKKGKQSCSMEQGMEVRTFAGTGELGPVAGKAAFPRGFLEQQPSRCSAEFCKCLLLLPFES